jgi:hypothetical protein
MRSEIHSHHESGIPGQLNGVYYIVDGYTCESKLVPNEEGSPVL